MRKMLRMMSGGEPVEIVVSMTTMTGLARLACVAEQFGYRYTDLRQVDKAFALRVAPDPTPRAQQRAARNRESYPNAADGVSLPPLAPEAVELLKNRMVVDLDTQFTDKQRVAIMVGGCTVMALAAGYGLREHRIALVVVGVVWAVLMALVPVGLLYTRRNRAKYTARLRSAGFRRVPTRGGRRRWVPPEDATL
ncbi:hypothetical protein ABZ330_13680 [Streptomyces sp. NPDC006172]|uniref:hypothetical protein n=1 Tax=Streptomyces sp. NPDC006172 TaxID=3154470 RepID=UPI0033CD6B7A